MFILLAIAVSSFPETPLTLHPNDPTKIAVCSGCKSHPNGQLSRRLASIPTCIEYIPYAKRKYLSPVYLNGSIISAVVCQIGIYVRSESMSIPNRHMSDQNLCPFRTDICQIGIVWYAKYNTDN